MEPILDYFQTRLLLLLLVLLLLLLLLTPYDRLTQTLTATAAVRVSYSLGLTGECGLFYCAQSYRVNRYGLSYKSGGSVVYGGHRALYWHH